ncbi:autophagy protein Apg5-domain-containing protein [Cryomyces antarcticus]
MPPSPISALQTKTWESTLPLEIRLSPSECRTFDRSDPYLIQFPRLSYLPFLLPRLHAFFSSALINPDVAAHEGWLSFEDVPLKWHYPLGLLYDLFSGAKPADLARHHSAIHGKNKVYGEERDSNVESVRDNSGVLPWRLVVHFTTWPEEQLIKLDANGKVLHDAFINSVKEADYTRNGTAKVVMSLSKDDSTALWRAVQQHDLSLFNTINNKLLNPPGSKLRHIPVKIYLPTTASPSGTTATEGSAASIRVVQSLVAPFLPSRQPQTLGTALNDILPTVFPSRRNPLLAHAVLHGAVVPLGAVLQDLGKALAYADGFLHVVVVMMA